jgi:hypothetical protein
MYTNIDPNKGINILTLYLEEFKHELSDTVINTKLIIDMMELIMNNNIFQFRDTFWLQKIGTAMGTPCACIYATIFFAWFERTKILIKYKDNLVIYKRQIDDIFGIWIDTPGEE